MAEYFSPGVYVEEYDNTPRSIEGVGTSTAGFVGFAEKGATVGAPALEAHNLMACDLLSVVFSARSAEYLRDDSSSFAAAS